jgi:hypothetical protein
MAMINQIEEPIEDRLVYYSHPEAVCFQTCIASGDWIQYLPAYMHHATACAHATIDLETIYIGMSANWVIRTHGPSTCLIGKKILANERAASGCVPYFVYVHNGWQVDMQPSCRTFASIIVCSMSSTCIGLQFF